MEIWVILCFKNIWMPNCFSIIYCKDYPFSIELLWHFCQNMTIDTWVYFWTFFSFLLSVCLFFVCVNITFLGGYNSFITFLKSDSVSPSIYSIFLFEIILAILGPLIFHINFRINSWIFTKLSSGILIGNYIDSTD